jgi:hypothetical protein
MTTDDFEAWLEGGTVLDTGEPTVDAWLDGAPVFSTTPEATPPEPLAGGGFRVAVGHID